MAYIPNKKDSAETDQEMTGMLEFAKKDENATIITMLKGRKEKYS